MPVCFNSCVDDLLANIVLIYWDSVRDLQTVDVSKSFSNTDSDLFTHIDKPYNASDPDEYPTFLDEGSAFNDGENLYFYGGYKSGRDGPKTVPPVETWKYDIQNNNWTRDGFGGVPLVRLIEGGAVVSHSQNKAYYLGGVEDPGGNPNIYGTAGADVEIVSGLLVLDQSTLQWSNLSTSEMNNYGTIGAGYLNLLEDVGDEGLLVAFGGYKYPVGHKVSLLCASQTNTTFHVCPIILLLLFVCQLTRARTLWNTSTCMILRTRNGTRSRVPGIFQTGGWRAAA